MIKMMLISDEDEVKEGVMMETKRSKWRKGWMRKMRRRRRRRSKVQNDKDDSGFWFLLSDVDKC